MRGAAGTSRQVEPSFLGRAMLCLRTSILSVHGDARRLLGNVAGPEVQEEDGEMTERSQRERTADGSWMLWTTIGLGVIWVAVLLISLFAPDLISGSQQEHLPLPAFTAWLWGLLGTWGFLNGMSKLRGDAERKPIWMGLGVAVMAIWALAAALSIWLPVVETGTDPTSLPLAALVAPLAAAVLTAVASMVVGVFARPPEG